MEKLTDEQVAALAKGYLLRHDGTLVHIGALTKAHVVSAALEVQQARARRCDGCEHWTATRDGNGWCHGGASERVDPFSSAPQQSLYTPATWSCADWQEKEKP